MEQIVPMRTVLKDKQVFPILSPIWFRERQKRHFGDQEAQKKIYGTQVQSFPIYPLVIWQFSHIAIENAIENDPVMGDL